jgi:hypothetical protein
MHFDVHAGGSFERTSPAPSTAAIRRTTLDRPAEGLRQLYGSSSSSSMRESSPTRQNGRETGGIRASSSGSVGAGADGRKPLPARPASAPQINAMGEVISRMSMQVRVSEHAQKKVSVLRMVSANFGKRLTCEIKQQLPCSDDMRPAQVPARHRSVQWEK